MEKIKQYQVGQIVICFLKKYNVVKKWFEVEIVLDIWGRIFLLFIFLSFKVLKYLDKKFWVGQVLRVIVVGLDFFKIFLCLFFIGFYKFEEGEVVMG